MNTFAKIIKSRKEASMINKLQNLIKDIEDVKTMMIQRLLYHGIPDKGKYNEGMYELADMMLLKEEVKEKLEFFNMTKTMCNEAINGSFEDMFHMEDFYEGEDDEKREDINLHDYVLSVLDMHHNYMTFSEEGLKRLEVYEQLTEEKREWFKKIYNSCYPEGGNHEESILNHLIEHRTGLNRFLSVLENLMAIREYNSYMVQLKVDLVGEISPEALYNKITNV